MKAAVSQLPPVAEKLLTVIVPSYDMERYLPKCLCSAVGVDDKVLDGLDVIVVNDGSNDETSVIAHDFERRHPGVVRVLDKRNGHYGSCVNAALPIARGEFVRILDADDFQNAACWSDFLEELSVYRDTDVDLVITRFMIADGTGSLTDDSAPLEMPERTPLEPMSLASSGKRLALHEVTYRRELLTRIGYRQTEGVPYTDTEWTTLPLLAVRRAVYLPIPATCYLLGRPGQTMEEPTFARDFHLVVKLLLDILEQYRKMSVRVASGNASFFEAQMFHLAKMVYSKLLLGNGVDRFTGSPVAFDDCLRQCAPRVYRRVHADLRFVRLWHRLFRLYCPSLKTCRLLRRYANPSAGGF